MAAIVAFGDSNTWGYDPATGRRFPPATRWTGVMATALGPSHHIIEEGLNGRTTVFDDPLDAGRRGADYLGPCLRSHAPFELLILALGCNDMKARFNVGAGEIAAGVERLVAMAQTEGGLKVLPGGAAAGRQTDGLRRAVPRRGGEVARAGGALRRGRGAARDRLRRRRPVHRLFRPRRHPLRGRTSTRFSGRALAEAVGIVLE